MGSLFWLYLKIFQHMVKLEKLLNSRLHGFCEGQKYGKISGVVAGYKKCCLEKPNRSVDIY